MELSELKAPFAPSEVSWRIGQSGKKGDQFWAQILAYIDNRNIMDRLDEVCGPEHWANEFKAGPSGGVICGISIEVSPDKWVTKWDGAENTDIEAVKGGLSDSMKRAANQWGIGRYLYDVGDTWADCSTERKQGYTYAKTKDGGIFYWAVPRDALAKLGPAPEAKKKADAIAKQHGMTTADKLPAKKVPADPDGNFDHVGCHRKAIAVNSTDAGLDAALAQIKANKDTLKEHYQTILVEWFKKATEVAADNERVRYLDEALAKAKGALGDDAFVKLGLALDAKYQKEAVA